MHKLREAAVVAAMVGSVCMLGAGVASAQESPTVNCDQNAGDNTATTQLGGTEITLTSLGDGGDADSSATQQICGIGNSDNDNEAGNSTGGTGTEVLGGGIEDVA